MSTRPLVYTRCIFTAIDTAHVHRHSICSNKDKKNTSTSFSCHVFLPPFRSLLFSRCTQPLKPPSGAYRERDLNRIIILLANVFSIKTTRAKNHIQHDPAPSGCPVHDVTSLLTHRLAVCVRGVEHCRRAVMCIVCVVVVVLVMVLLQV
uniref:Uncharacterized protein n=1 Tax=Anopheles melas TaxID=34690 RepID=A0A182TES6_9DIPT